MRYILRLRVCFASGNSEGNSPLQIESLESDLWCACFITKTEVLFFLICALKSVIFDALLVGFWSAYSQTTRGLETLEKGISDARVNTRCLLDKITFARRKKKKRRRNIITRRRKPNSSTRSHVAAKTHGDIPRTCASFCVRTRAKRCEKTRCSIPG